MSKTALNKAKNELFLDKKRWNIKGVPSSWRDRIGALSILGKSMDVEEYSKQKVNGCYAKLANPKKTYWIHYREGAEDFCLEVPKIVYDDVICVER